MRTADEIFKKIGFEKTEKLNTAIIYKSSQGSIIFWLQKKAISIHVDNSQYPTFEVEELQAINEKVKELRLEQLDRREER